MSIPETPVMTAEVRPPDSFKAETVPAESVPTPAMPTSEGEDFPAGTSGRAAALGL